MFKEFWEGDPQLVDRCTRRVQKQFNDPNLSNKLSVYESNITNTKIKIFNNYPPDEIFHFLYQYVCITFNGS